MDLQTVNTYSTLIFGIGQVVLGASIALWAIFKTRKDAAVTQNENMKLQMQQQIRSIVLSAYKDFKHQREMIDAEFRKKSSGDLDIHKSLMLTGMNFKRLSNTIDTFIDDFSLLGSHGVVEICNNISREVNTLNSEFYKLKNELTDNEHQYSQTIEAQLEWMKIASAGLSDKVNELKNVITKYQDQLVEALRKDMGITI